MHIPSLAIGAIGGSVITALVYRANTVKATALVSDLVDHIKNGTANEEAAAIAKIKTYIAAKFPGVKL